MSTGRPARAFSARLIDWQRQHGRHDLPWQNTRDAYRIWLSEIMLQQTQVGTVIPYYARFIERFASIEALAQAPLTTVLERWAGLGYYARARNLHRCAQTVVADHRGAFPSDLPLLNELPGIGRSTAAAISIFAFGKRAAILDGNVKRVLARCFGIDAPPGLAQTEKTMWSLADALLPKTHIEAYTQGLMDLGATVCTRSKPSCETCPLHAMCIARQENRQAELPVAKPGKVLPERETTLLLLTDGQRVLLERRPPAGIWGGLLALPEAGASGASALARRHGCRLLDTQRMPALKHSFSHFRLTIQTVRCSVEARASLAAEAGWEWLAHSEIETAALPTPIRRLLRMLRESTQQTPE
ncbi:A/G-specific adenine glycosylase [Propionivibrio sp.]|uniref:A/G-specific adenine glycosylase n=1 Tax=Propionivibrio sp. TaxID=2212460 RepID=UPI0025EC30E7|nr:A/G-specific adenine glycosylase [Propionivibrio sp.]MBK8745866.1 A/G-specific adenine glycosylase [Propionivibrio sp.]